MTDVFAEFDRAPTLADLAVRELERRAHEAYWAAHDAADNGWDLVDARNAGEAAAARVRAGQ